MTKQLATTIVAMLIIVVPAEAKDYRVQWVEAVNNDVQCKSHQEGWFSTTTGPCSDFKAPDTIAVGESFFAVGAARVIHVIVATQSEEDYSVGDWTVKKGDWYCVAAESPSDLDTDGSARRIWLLIPHCVPVR